VTTLSAFPLATVDWTTLPQQLVNGFLLGAIYALVALGYTMVYGVLKLINFAHGEVFMLGSYGALFTSWMLGFGPGGNEALTGSWVTLLIMLIGSMLVSGTAGFLIERFAYRPIRNHPRIASLITAIGLSLLLQYGGQAFLLEGKKQAITSKVNPFADNLKFDLIKPNEKLRVEAATLQAQLDETQKAYDIQFAKEKDRFNPSPEGAAIDKKLSEVKEKQSDITNRANASAMKLEIPKGKLIMLATILTLMGSLWYLVMKTRMGRAMRAVSVDFNAASLMGINLNTVITFTFILGSVLAGAGAMMYSTFQSAPIDPFQGMAPGVKAFVAAVLGGIGNIPGAVLGALLMGIAENLVTWAGYSSYRDAIAFVILIAVLLFRPGGILGSNKVEKV
jgi:branched-chain amino acid transport system permease protein